MMRMDGASAPRRGHALQRPLHGSQVLAIGSIALAVSVFYGFSADELPASVYQTVAGLFGVQVAMVTLLFLLVSFRDTAHPAVYDGKEFKLPSPTRRIKCSLCHVRNYPLFVGLLTCTILLIATQLSVTTYALIQQRHNPTAHGVTMALAVVLSLLPLFQLICLVILAMFHLYITTRGLRTYEWINDFHRRQRRSSTIPRKTSSALTARSQQMESSEEVKQALQQGSSTRSLSTTSRTELSASPLHEDDQNNLWENEERDELQPGACEPFTAILVAPDERCSGHFQDEIEALDVHSMV